MHCTNCGTELIAGKQFCHACGTRVSQTCPTCGATVQTGFRFCPDCGNTIGDAAPDTATPPHEPPRLRPSPSMPDELAQKIRASKDAIEGERKQVTVLFCDLAGSTAMAERLDPEEYHDLLEQYLELAFREIYRFEGIVNQLAGDGFMALFGAPIAHEDAPQRAVRAGLRIQQALAGLNEQLLAERGLELRARIGIHTGPVVVGSVGNDLKMDYSAIGDTTNLASRLESLAQPGTILASEATHRLVRGRFQVRPVGPFPVKGKTEPVTAYEVLGLSEASLLDTATPMAIAAERGLTPLVGRSAELAQIDACYQRLEASLPQLVAIVGDPGSGKSRLLYEFKQRLAGDSTTVFEARGSAWNQMVPYHPFIAMLRRYFDLAPDDSDELARNKLATKVRVWDPQLDRLYPALCRMLSIHNDTLNNLSEEELTRASFEAIAKLVGLESHRAPVVMIMEDLHWMDEPSREMVQAAVAELFDARVMMLVSHRPDYRPVWRTQAAFTQVTLRRLPDQHVTDIIRAIAEQALPEALEELIRSKAEGSPFLTEEITRSLLEEGLTGTDGHRLSRPVEEIRIPGTVQEVIAARLDRLGTEAKRVVQVAAVLGRQFSRRHLVQLLVGENVDVGRELDELERRGVLHRRNVFSNDEYRFGESMTQEVAYEGLLLKQRRQLHERIGTLLEADTDIAPGERAALLAHHFGRSDNRSKGVAALLRAARDAEKVPSFRTAARLYREAWDLAAPALEREATAELQHAAVDAVTGICRMTIIYNTPCAEDTESVIVRGRHIAEQVANPGALAGLLMFNGMLVMGMGRERFAEGLALAEQGLAVVQEAGLGESAIAVSRGLAWSYLLDGRFALAQRTIEWVIQELDRAGQREQLSDVFLGSLYLQNRIDYHAGNIDASMAGTRQAYELGVRAGNRTVQSGGAGMLAQVHFVRGEYADALRWAERCIEVARAVANVGACRVAMAVAVLARRALGEPVTNVRDLEVIAHEIREETDFGLAGHLVVDAFIAVGDFEAAAQLASRTRARAAGRLREMLSALAMGNVLAELGPERWREAERSYSEAIALAEAIGARSTLAIARVGAGVLADTAGDHSTSRRHLQQALPLCQDLGLRHYQARAERLLMPAAPSAAAEPQSAQG